MMTEDGRSYEGTDHSSPSLEWNPLNDLDEEEIRLGKPVKPGTGTGKKQQERIDKALEAARNGTPTIPRRSLSMADSLEGSEAMEGSETMDDDSLSELSPEMRKGNAMRLEKKLSSGRTEVIQSRSLGALSVVSGVSSVISGASSKQPEYSGESDHVFSVTSNNNTPFRRSSRAFLSTNGAASIKSTNTSIKSTNTSNTKKQIDLANWRTKEVYDGEMDTLLNSASQSSNSVSQTSKDNQKLNRQESRGQNGSHSAKKGDRTGAAPEKSDPTWTPHRMHSVNSGQFAGFPHAVAQPGIDSRMGNISSPGVTMQNDPRLMQYDPRMVQMDPRLMMQYTQGMLGNPYMQVPYPAQGLFPWNRIPAQEESSDDSDDSSSSSDESSRSSQSSQEDSESSRSDSSESSEEEDVPNVSAYQMQLYMAQQMMMAQAMMNTMKNVPAPNSPKGKPAKKKKKKKAVSKSIHSHSSARAGVGPVTNNRKKSSHGMPGRLPFEAQTSDRSIVSVVESSHGSSTSASRVSRALSPRITPKKKSSIRKSIPEESPTGKKTNKKKKKKGKKSSPQSKLSTLHEDGKKSPSTPRNSTTKKKSAKATPSRSIPALEDDTEDTSTSPSTSGRGRLLTRSKSGRGIKNWFGGKKTKGKS